MYLLTPFIYTLNPGDNIRKTKCNFKTISTFFYKKYKKFKIVINKCATFR